MDFHLESALTLLGRVLEKRYSTVAWVLAESSSAAVIRWIWYRPVS